jgi:hypothetical protein
MILFKFFTFLTLVTSYLVGQDVIPLRGYTFSHTYPSPLSPLIDQPLPLSPTFKEVFQVVKTQGADSHPAHTASDKLIFSISLEQKQTTEFTVNKVLVLKYSSLVRGIYESEAVEQNGDTILLEAIPLHNACRPKDFENLIELLHQYDQNLTAYQNGQCFEKVALINKGVINLANYLFSDNKKGGLEGTSEREDLGFFHTLLQSSLNQLFSPLTLQENRLSDTHEKLDLFLPTDIYDTALPFTLDYQAYIFGQTLQKLAQKDKLSEEALRFSKRLKNYFTPLKQCRAFQQLKSLSQLSGVEKEFLDILSHQFIRLTDRRDSQPVSQSYLVASSDELKEGMNMEKIGLFFSPYPEKTFIVDFEKSRKIGDRFTMPPK